MTQFEVSPDPGPARGHHPRGHGRALGRGRTGAPTRAGERALRSRDGPRAHPQPRGRRDRCDPDPDEGIRPDSTVETLAGLAPAAQVGPRPRPGHHAGNSSQMSDGAAAMLIADRSTAEALGLPVRARFVSFAVGADDAVLVLSAPNPVTRKLLERSGMTIDQFDSDRVQRGVRRRRADAGLAEFLPDGDLSRLNRRGGAIAVGHPLGASACAWRRPLLATSRRPAVDTASRRCARAAARPTPPSSNAWLDL